MKNLSIRFKLLLLVSIPLTSVIISSLLSIQNERESYHTSGQLVQLTELAGYSGNLVHELQKERGATAIFLQSQGRTYKEELQQQRQLTNAALDSINTFLSGFDVGNFDPSFATHMGEFRNKLNAIPDLRESISSLNISPGEAIATYTSTNAHVLETVGIMMTLGDDVEMSNLLASYFFFMQSKERAGIERAVVSQVFTKGFTTQADIMKYSRLVEAQEAYIKSFQTVATPAHMTYYGQQMENASVNEVQRMRSVVVAGPQNGGYGIDAPEWFATITKKINLLKDVENRLEHDLLLKATAHQTEAFQALLFTSSMSLLIIILSILICIVVIRSISNPIQALEAAAEEVAKGNASVQVPAQGKDEIARLSESFNAMVVSIRDSASKIAFEQQQTKEALESAESSRLNAELAKDEALASKSNAEKALREAEMAKAQAMEAMQRAEASKSETEVALKEAEAAKADALQAKNNAEASKKEAEKALVEAEASKAEALEAKKNAEASQAETEAALKDAEKAKADALQAKNDAEASKQEAEKALVEAEASKAEALEAKNNAEASKQEAEKALVEAEASKKEAEKALVDAEASKAEALQAKNNAEASKVETEAALKEAEAAKADALQAKNDAEASKQEAEKALVGAEASKAEALQAKHSAEVSKQEAEKALVEAEASKAKALEAQKKAVASKTETEKALKEAEVAQSDALKAKTGAEASQKEAEKALIHAERSKAEALQSKHEAEQAMKEVEATQQRVQKAHRELEGSVELMLNVIDKFANGDMTVRLPKNDNATINRLFRGFNDAASTIGEFINKVNTSVA
ncbi:MAG: nitrate- and nitrite sensing domain-containing protein, partial [Rhodothermaceae bacterium]|nr:nitrate- and nitrite sensing domain-containing protein [Rhodothermaceae bacterium]